MHNWLKGIGFPETPQQFADQTTDKDGLRDPLEVFSDGSLHILNSNFQDVAIVKFNDLFPVALTSLEFDATETDINYFTAEATMRYTVYNIFDTDARTRLWILKKFKRCGSVNATIDPDNLHNESLKIPQLHSKYYTIYNTISLLREKARDSYNRIRLERYNYYTGKAPAEVYVEDPFPYKVREKDAIQRHMEADEKLSTAEMKIKYYDVTT